VPGEQGDRERQDEEDGGGEHEGSLAAVGDSGDRKGYGRRVTDSQDSDERVTGPIDVPHGAPFVSEAAFEIPERPLARGGMAVIYEAADRRLPRQVILKRPRAEEDLPIEDRRAFVERLEAEALVLARLQHPAIVTLYELGRASGGGVPFCVLERVEGKSLRARLDAVKQAEDDGEPQTAARLELVTGLVGIAEALAYSHERGIVHRDVTPGNILLGARGEMTLIDWGLAKDTSASNAAEAPMTGGIDPAGQTISAGTPPYVCFEQTQGEPASPRYDVYSLGVVLYEVVSGRPAYKFETPEDADAQEYQLRQFLRWARSGKPPDPAQPRDAELSGIIARAMTRDAAERFTADELVRALKQYLTGDLVFSHRYSLTGRIARWVRRNRGVTIAGALAIAAVIAAGLVWTTSRARDAERLEEKSRDEALLLAQQLEAGQAQLRAADAETRASDAERAAAEAKRDGKESRELQAAAERLRKEAEREAKSASRAAEDATDTATDAQAKWKQANAERDAALTARDAADQARAAAETARDTARTDAATATRERDTAKADAARAATDRDAALTDRDAAIAARTTAEAQRTAAEDARSAAEQDRDAALARIRALEARIKELEASPPPPPPAPDAGP